MVSGDINIFWDVLKWQLELCSLHFYFSWLKGFPINIFRAAASNPFLAGDRIKREVPPWILSNHLLLYKVFRKIRNFSGTLSKFEQKRTVEIKRRSYFHSKIRWLSKLLLSMKRNKWIVNPDCWRSSTPRSTDFLLP